MKSTATSLPTLVVGGGVTGLTVAYRLWQAGRPVILIEASGRTGGNICTERRDGFLYDVGPDSFLKTKPDAVKLCKDLGLELDLIAPRPGASRVLVAHDGALHPMPEGLSLGVPKRPGALLDSALLSGLGKARALLEPFVPRRREAAEESILAFTTRRLGSEMASKLVAPLLAGVFAGDASKLSMEAAFPQLVQLEQEYGSLFSGMNRGKSILSVLWEEPRTQESPFLSLRGGLGQLIDALTQALPEGYVHLNERVTALKHAASEPHVVRVETEENFYEAGHVVLAGPPWSAAALLQELDTELFCELGAVRGHQTATVFFGLSEAQVEADLRGSGFIVPEGEGSILAGTFISSKWEGRAPQGQALVRAFLGGARADISGQTDAQLERVAWQELSRLTGPLGSPLFSRVYRYLKGSPQPELGHLERLRAIDAMLRKYPWLSLAGSGLSGVGIPDCVRQAEALARRSGRLD